MRMFCFNNVDLLLNKGQILSLELEDIHHKIVTRRRGGYCFEHNKLFYAMAKDIHIDATAYLARVTFNSTDELPKNHRITIVKLNGKEYLAEVGFGRYAPTCLVPLNGTVVTSPNGNVFRITQNEEVYALEIIKDGGFFTLYVFEKTQCFEIDFELANYYTNCHPDSGFTKNLTLARIGETKTFVIRENVFSTTENGIAQQIEIADAKDLQKKLYQSFTIEISTEQAEILF